MRLASIFTYRANGGRSETQPSFPEGMPSSMLVYNWFARARGWTPRQVDELSLEEMEWLPIVEEAIMLAQDQMRPDPPSPGGY
jgi:hypothetical protein